MNKKLLLLTSLYFMTLGWASAQAKKINADPLIWTELQADYMLANQSFFFFRNQYRHNTNSDFAGIQESGALSKFYQIYVLAGYDQKFTDHWRGAVWARYTFDARNDNQIYAARLQHNGKIGETDFIKRALYDIMNFEEGDSRGRFRPSAALERNFTLGSLTLRPHLSYELFFYNDFQEADPAIDTRTVDRTRLRVAAGFQVSEHFWVTPFFTKQTEYYNVLPSYVNALDPDGNLVLDPDGNPVLIEKEPGGKRNRIDPIFGLELRLILPSRNVSESTTPTLEADQ